MSTTQGEKESFAVEKKVMPWKKVLPWKSKFCGGKERFTVKK